MPVMETPKFTLPTSMRANPGVKKRLKIRLLQLEEVTPIRFGDQEELTIEAVTNALWQFFTAMDDDAATAFLGREFPALQAAMSSENPRPLKGVKLIESEEPDGSDSSASKPRRRPRRRQ